MCRKIQALLKYAIERHIFRVRKSLPSGLLISDEEVYVIWQYAFGEELEKLWINFDEIKKKYQQIIKFWCALDRHLDPGIF